MGNGSIRSRYTRYMYEILANEVMYLGGEHTASASLKHSNPWQSKYASFLTDLALTLYQSFFFAAPETITETCAYVKESTNKMDRREHPRHTLGGASSREAAPKPRSSASLLILHGLVKAALSFLT